jgi:Arc/MetJ-type ribon-helix-helix transcriptional regulator
MPQRTIRLPEPIPEQIEREARRRGYASTSAFIRDAIQRELDGNHVLSENKEQQAESARIQQALARIMTIQQAQFALFDELAQVVLRCLPEPSSAEQEHASALAKKRHEQLLTMAALHMQGNARQVLEEFTGHDE